jgi:hypothetical protein
MGSNRPGNVLVVGSMPLDAVGQVLRDCAGECADAAGCHYGHLH